VEGVFSGGPHRVVRQGTIAHGREGAAMRSTDRLKNDTAREKGVEIDIARRGGENSGHRKQKRLSDLNETPGNKHRDLRTEKTGPRRGHEDFLISRRPEKKWGPSGGGGEAGEARRGGRLTDTRFSGDCRAQRKQEEIETRPRAPREATWTPRLGLDRRRGRRTS